ncbi:MAG: type I restriction endonuclease [Bacteroidota bacterium]
MPSQTNEAALEASIQKSLTGHSIEEIPHEQGDELGGFYRTGHGFFIGFPQDFDPKYAIDKKRFWHFLESTQADELAKLQRHADWKLKILSRLDRLIKKYGLLRLLRKGLEVDDAHFTLFYQLPLGSASKTLEERFESNEFSITRQIRYNLDNPRQEIDMVLFLNGLPISTLELKNPWTGQNARYDAQKQYRNDRDFTQPLLNFGRCLVHFAVDTDEVYMTTRLKGASTFFLPFNKGHNDGKGNPPNPNGHKSAYLWEEIFTRESLANIIQHFVRFDGKAKDPLDKRTLFFPRYHQLDVVRKLVAHAGHNGVGQTYLIQHSAGSGKSYSITWAAYQLIETYPLKEGIPGSKGLDLPLFDSVIVVTDRRLLDKQLRESIREFSEVKNILAPAHSSADLRNSLEVGKKIIITTIQKFPYIVDGIADLSGKRFAVIIDEAHSSQGGGTHGKMNASMGKVQQEEEPEDVQEKIAEIMEGRKMRDNASYFAFTATPKNVTLEKFGDKQLDESFVPFHLYSMKQAIEEGFILDVIANYTTYRSYYEIQKSIEDNPKFDTKKAQKKLRAYVERNQHTIHTKAEIMLDHFIDHVHNPKKLRGKAKAMVVTQSIESAIRYFRALNKLLDQRGNPFKIIVAFSGEKKVDGVSWKEEGINDLPAHLDTASASDPGYIADKIARYFDMDEYRILVVANKYLTGFDQPKLCAMYVDKRLQGVIAVQALSRLNRSAPKLGKKTEDLFVLDFFNTTKEIKEAFDPFYTATTLNEGTDINVLHDLKANLDDVGVYEQYEIEDFVVKYFNDVDAQQLSPIIDQAAKRFNKELELSQEEKADFKIKAKQFVKIYGQVASILDFEMVSWEKLFWFLKFLIPKLIIEDKDKDLLDSLLESVDLSTYGLERVRLKEKIELDASTAELDPLNPNPRRVHGSDKEKDLLEEIVRVFNERWFQGWDQTPEERRIKLLSLQKKLSSHPDFKLKVAENKDQQNQDLALLSIMDEVMSKQRRAELGFYRKYISVKGRGLASSSGIGPI